MRKRDLATRVLKYHIRQKGATLLLGAFFLLGALLGTQVYRFCGEEERQLLEALLSIAPNSTFAEVFHRQILCEGALLLLLFLSGFCALGQSAAAFLLLFRGLGLGISGVCLAQQGRESFQLYLLILLPQTLIFFLLQLAASKEAAAFSMNFLRQLLGLSGMKGLSITPKIYILRFVLLFLLSFFAAFAVTLLSLFLIRFL